MRTTMVWAKRVLGAAGLLTLAACGGVEAQDEDTTADRKSVV